MIKERKIYGNTCSDSSFIRNNNQDNSNVFSHVVQTSGAVHCSAKITVSEMETALAYLCTQKDSDPNLFYETKIVEGRLASLFVADSTAQLDYACFGDTMAVCTMNSYKMHFVILAGLNHHHQTCI
ncbi:hypothetical protein GLYMA_04G207500v4 [Glycine max]|uniref:Uncharacterized protein n=1 Tax=Glycine max TaxID=3847 RepID=K7KLD0_SOYBN|nr:hypothetical protein JHK87_010765 [Glycine soja]KAG5050102.1 hypothetical protein JHK85_011205 [Glycine max]KAG5067163.1 hypothetical protein JHK86_010894 [Glycine max]KAH1112407.1 hypothetical protein GYH30_010603 [Glycine max]KRH63963.1 hypothetical protein GLYMA_04G207500v4 [Glycine max]